MGDLAPTYTYASVQQVKRNLAAGSVTVSWNTGGTQYSLTDDSAGNLTGDGTGEVSYSNGLIFFNPSPTPAPSDGDYSIDYQQWSGTTKGSGTVAIIDQTGTSTIYQPGVPIRPGSVEIRLELKRITKKVVYLAARGKPDVITYATENVTLTDDGDGNLRRNKGGAVMGSVNYATGEISFDPRISRTFILHEEKRLWYMAGGSYFKAATGNATESYESAQADVNWIAQADPVDTQTTTRPIPGVTIDLVPGASRSIFANSVIFSIGGTEYRDQDGAIIKDWSPVTDSGIVVGSIDYSSGLVTLNDYPANLPTSTPVTLTACLTAVSQSPANRTIFRTAGSPLREGSLIVNATDVAGNQITLNADTSGNLTGAPGVSGFVDTQTGLVKIEWTDDALGEPVIPNTVRYSAVSFTFLPLDAELVGLDATRLPSDGRVPQFNRGDVIVISNTQQQEVITATAGAVVTFARQNQAEVYVEGANGNRLAAEQYTLDTDAGTLTFADPLSLIDSEANAVTEPLQVFDRVEDMGLATDVQIGGQISLNIPLSQDYTAGDTIASASLLYGDLRARAHNAFHQKSWSGTWADDRVGDDTTAKYNLVANPFEITNQGAIKERWAIRFTSSTTFDVIGETVGVVATGNISADLAPTNQATGAPCFTIRKEGWGSGWVSGNTLRFNTDGGQAPFWVARTIVAGRAVEEEDQFATQNRGDAD